MKKIALILIITFITNAGFSQTETTLPAVDAKTYDQYLKKQWTELIETGKIALKNNIDFYYLRVRMGIAYYEQKKYSLAAKQFEKAHEQNRRDDVINEYLYFSYIFSENYDDARLIVPFFSETLSKKLNIQSSPIIKAIYFDTKKDFFENFVLDPESSDSIQQIAVTNQQYYNISLEHQLGKRARVFHGYTHMIVDNTIQDLPTADRPTLYEETVNQNEYYFSLNLHIAKQSDLKTSFHFLSSNFAALDSASSLVSRGRRSLTNSYYYYYKVNTFAGVISFTKKYPYFSGSATVSVSNLNNYFQLQPSLTLSISPFANEKLSINSQLIYHNQFDAGTLTTNTILKESISVNFLKHFYFEPSITIGTLYNYTEFDGLIANNDLDPITSRYDALLNISLAKTRFNIFFKYTYTEKQNDYRIYGINYNQEYINQSITGGIKWYF